jgi:septal ring factor EnvC (AmiA/AmiB activator)
MLQGEFAKFKGKLPFPIANSKVLSPFGRVYDPRSKLYVFKKGIDLVSSVQGKSEAVRAIHSGKIAYSGKLPDYGNVTIVDHGDHFYSLCAHLGSLQKKAGEIVAAGDVIGSTDDSGTPIYFEIRARNVAVNPLQWVSN